MPSGAERDERGVALDTAGSSEHTAAAPGQLTRAAWGAVLRRTGRHLGTTHLPVLSAGIAFFAVLSIAPVLVTALSVYGAVHTPEEARAQLSGLAGVLPDALDRVVADQLTTITTASTNVLTRRGLTGLLVALWTATTAATCLVEALTLAYHETETRSWWRRTRLGLALVLGGALLLGGLLTAAGVVSGVVDDAPSTLSRPLGLLWWPVLALVMTGVLAVLYRYGPDRSPARYRWISWGAAAATGLWLLTSGGLFAYVQRLGTYEATYGSLAGVAISMFWLWITVLLVVAGAALNAETERQTVLDSTVGPPQPLGERGAVVADSAPPYPEDGPDA
jgi:membrane protein